MKQRPDWTDRLRERLDDASLTPPAEGWQRLDEALRRQAPQPRRRPLGVLPLRYRVPLAAALLVGALLTGFYLRPTIEPDPAPLLAVTETPAPRGEAPETTDRETSAPAATVPETAGSQPLSETHRLSATTPHRDARGADRTTHGESARPSQAQQPAEETHPAKEAQPAKEMQPAKEARPAQTPQRSEHANDAHRSERPNSTQRPSDADRRAYFAEVGPHGPIARRTARTRTSLGLFGRGVLTTAAPDRGTFVSAYISSNSSASLSATLLNTDLAARKQNDYARAEFDHSRPWSFGLSLRKGFGHGLALETGLVYTQLRSEVRMCGNTLDQRLHLLGVPLRLDWSFIDRPRGGLYIGAGGLVETCLRARLGDESRSEHGLQASLAAVVGAEYRFTRFAALYAEPEWSYALTETKLRTIRTNHPSTFTLRVGVRFSF